MDDQAIVAQAVSRLLADLPEIDLDYCSDSIEAIKEANRIKPTVILIQTISGDVVRKADDDDLGREGELQFQASFISAVWRRDNNIYHFQDSLDVQDSLDD